jgi:hypothetical protein
MTVARALTSLAAVLLIEGCADTGPSVPRDRAPSAGISAISKEAR